jgi:hypothetical protein
MVEVEALSNMNTVIDDSNNKRKKSAKKRSTQVPGQFYGYSLQITRLVARLLECSHGQAVSLEVIGDVGVTGDAGTVAEEDKSGLAHNPVADRAVDLWKTLFNWVGDIRSGALNTETKFVLYVAQPHTGRIIKKLHEVRHPKDAMPLIAELRDEFWGKAPQRSKKASLSDTSALYVNGVLEASDDTLSRLFAGLEFKTGTGSPNDDLAPLLASKAAVGTGAIEKILDSLLGWTKRRIDKLIESNKPAIITWEEFNQQLIAAARKHDRSELLTPTPVEITESEVENELQNRQYIQQLRWIDCSDRYLVRAVNDYLRSATDRTIWSERGDVLELSFDEFSDQLERYWNSRKRRSAIEFRDRSEVELGQVVFADCESASANLQGLEVPSYFVPGSYHALADTFTIGWHPRFEELRKEVAKMKNSVPTNDDNEDSSNEPPAE